MKTSLIIIAFLTIWGNATAQQWRKAPYNAEVVFDVPNPPQVVGDTLYRYAKVENKEWMVQWVRNPKGDQVTVYLLKNGGGDDYNMRGIRRIAVALTEPFISRYSNKPDQSHKEVLKALEIFGKNYTFDK